MHTKPCAELSNFLKVLADIEEETALSPVLFVCRFSARSSFVSFYFHSDTVSVNIVAVWNND